VTQRKKWEMRSEKINNGVRSEKVESQKSNLSFLSPASSFTLPTSLIKKDLTKTGILTMLAISLELVVYWIWH